MRLTEVIISNTRLSNLVSLEEKAKSGRSSIASSGGLLPGQDLSPSLRKLGVGWGGEEDERLLSVASWYK